MNLPIAAVLVSGCLAPSCKPDVILQLKGIWSDHLSELEINNE